MPYRADIDDLRTIAVLAVLGFHYASRTVPCGTQSALGETLHLRELPQPGESSEKWTRAGDP